MPQDAEAISPAPPRVALRHWLKPVIFFLCLLPLAWLAVRALTGGLGANPIEAVVRYLGDWALRFILIALAVTPTRLVTGWNDIGRLRRMLGLFAFTYVFLHIMAYVGLDQFFDWSAIGRDIVKRLYITFGMAAFTMLIPLAITSTNGMVRRLGGARWRILHLLVYPAAIAGVTHYFYMIKAGFTQPLIYAVTLAALFAVRLYKKWV